MREQGPLPDGVERMVHEIVDQESIVAITDKRGAIVYANDRFCEISGYSRQELIGQNHRLLKSGHHPDAFYRDLWKTILSGRTWKGEICNRAKDGRLYWVETILSPLRQDGLITHFVALRTDITAKKEAEVALSEREKRDEEERRVLALGHLANGVLHDLNNILTGILGLTAEADSRMRDAMLQGAIGKMVQLTRTLREYSAGLPSEQTRFRLNPVLSCVASLVRFRKGVPRTFVIEESLERTQACEVFGNEAQVFEIVLNLAVNAVEASMGQTSPRVRLSTELHDSVARITLADNGRGIPEEIREHLFEDNISSKGQGRGLGLSMARRIALSHGGDLRLDDPGGRGGGARFTLEIPVKVREEAPAPGDDLRLEPHPDRRLLLVSDDDANVRRMIENVAGRMDLEVVYPAPGEDILDTALSHHSRIAAAVIDCCDLESDQCAVARLRGGIPGLPILLISATLTCSGRQRSRWGMVEELPKPFDARELIQSLGAVTIAQGAG